MSDNNTYKVADKAKTYSYILMGVGVLGLLLAFVFDSNPDYHGRFWSNLTLNTYYFAGIGLTGLFFIAAHQLGYGGFHTIFKRVPLSMSRVLWVMFPIATILALAAIFGDGHLNNVYNHWMHPHNVNYADTGCEPDRIVSVMKKPFLNIPMFLIVVIGFFGIWAFFSRVFNNKLIHIKSFSEYQNSKYWSAAFILVFAVSMSFVAWMFVMSIDPHWYSTLFGWYNFASYACAGFSMMILILIYLKSKGYYQHVTEDHIHDLGKYLFGFSIFWTYLWFSQFMLIWYANIPEATIWYDKRFEVPLFKALFFIAFGINFFIPVLILMRRITKRKFAVIGFVCVMVIFGHYLDFYGMIMFEPNAVVEHHGPCDHHDDHHTEEHANILVEEGRLLADKGGHSDSHAIDSHDSHGENNHTESGHDAHGEHHVTPKTYAKIGLAEIFIFCGFLGLFLFMFHGGINNEDLEDVTDPFINESKHHHI